MTPRSRAHVHFPLIYKDELRTSLSALFLFRPPPPCTLHSPFCTFCGSSVACKYLLLVSMAYILARLYGLSIWPGLACRASCCADLSSMWCVPSYVMYRLLTTAPAGQLRLCHYNPDTRQDTSTPLSLVSMCFINPRSPLPH